MPVVIVVGAQWGDEGKGKVVDVYAAHADVIVRYGGGANAGHTLVVDGEKVVFHLVPSGALHEGKECVIAQGTVIDPEVLTAELTALRDRGALERSTVLLSDRAHIVLPHHRQVDSLREQGTAAIGTTKRGIGPAYEDKVARRGIRAGDLLRPDRLAVKVRANVDAWRPVIEALGGEAPEPDALTEVLLTHGDSLRPHVTDTAHHLTRALADGRRILVEGAQGTMLDIDHGTYPYVTSSSVVAGGATASSGIPPTAVDRVVGITKAYTTRVGGGPFPTELEGEVGTRLREAGSEYGATTGRPRRCGWLDLPALRFAVEVNGMTELCVTKLDVLAGMQSLEICVGYELEGERIDRLPYDDADLSRVVPVLEEAERFAGDLSGCRARADLPPPARRYLERIEELTGCPIGLVGVGADREETLGAKDPFA